MTQAKETEYWARFWSEYKTDVANKDEQSQVLRTRNKQPIDDRSWAITVETVAHQLELGATDTLLDLCCGNGLFTAAFSERIASIEAVDISAPLIERLNERKLANVRAQAMDIREASFEAASLSRVLWYAGIQYIDEGDIVAMVRKIRHWMKPGGVLMIGDIPDRSKVWGYFNDPVRRDAYFSGLEKRQPIIGTWLDGEWIEKLCIAMGFSEATAVAQDPRLIYADFRFDLIARL
ncbi:Methyltransferase domain-containing protein [Paraburkholderia fungorum]|uniref:Methyltransferase domain-containing protein n=1 Tax=Paraburkholderia fungorum TaxID=134537 RepID=A0A1H0YM66_9BURK|nr:class I SAM-dependent methyltransferase [Paraburkholderia fungorum]SDQ16317.1 Methyltransferase domain-containing protein [Paraburkholderia fungorum]